LDLEQLLTDGEVMCHSFVIGELACGNLKNKDEILALLHRLPRANRAKHEEVLEFIEKNRLMGKGLGYVDVHLSASAVLTGVQVWTYDKRLNDANEALGIRCIKG
jgi:predicted nucleic acid-binding protein